MSIHEHKTATTIVAELMMTRTRLPDGSFGPWFEAHAALTPWDLVNGHDLVELLTAGLRHALGSLPGSRSSGDVASALRLAVDSTELRRSALFDAVWAWEHTNPSHAILRREFAAHRTGTTGPDSSARS